MRNESTSTKRFMTGFNLHKVYKVTQFNNQWQTFLVVFKLKPVLIIKYPSVSENVQPKTKYNFLKSPMGRFTLIAMSVSNSNFQILSRTSV